MTEREYMLAGKLYDPSDPVDYTGGFHCGKRGNSAVNGKLSAF